MANTRWAEKMKKKKSKKETEKNKINSHTPYVCWHTHRLLVVGVKFSVLLLYVYIYIYFFCTLISCTFCWWWKWWCWELCKLCKKKVCIKKNQHRNTIERFKNKRKDLWLVKFRRLLYVIICLWHVVCVSLSFLDCAYAAWHGTRLVYCMFWGTISWVTYWLNL